MRNGVIRLGGFLFFTIVLLLSSIACNPSGPTSPEYTTPPKDTTPPSVTNVQPSSTIKTTSASVGAYYSDSGSGIDNASANVYLDNVAIATCTRTTTSINCTTQGLAEGIHNITASVKDVAGNLGKGTGSFTVDTTGPVFNQLSPSGSSLLSTQTIIANYSDVGSGVDKISVVVSLDGTQLTNCAPTDAGGVMCFANGLASGDHNYNVTVKDKVGNASTGSGSFSIQPIGGGGGNTTGPTALCNDGTYSYSQHRRGTCSYHGGVGQWLRNDIPS
ncbi:MAG: Ig-like domain-containing protein [Thermoleophilia bacterium]